MQQVLEANDIHRLGKNIFHDLANQRVVRYLDIAFDILLARSYIGEDGGEKIVGADAQNLRRNLLPITVPQQGQSPAGVPAPSRLRDRRSERRLLQHLLHALFAQELEDISKWEAMLFGQSNVQAILSSGSLKFEVERAAEAFAQRQSPSFIDARAQRGMN